MDGNMCRRGRVSELELASAGVDGASSIFPFLIGSGNNVHIVPQLDPSAW